MAPIRLQSLQLTGFKSFPDGVELSFPGDISAILGPNGCGKSNLVDAILWVLGEQSPSLLRLKIMGDVVFQGSSSRPAAGAAEVALRLRSDEGHWPETEGTLNISRRVYRSGPSEYRLNGRNSRLKDVVDELLAIGLGTRNYSIIEQGRVGQVLSARPTDRRVLLEEASGITRYKVRRREAELKLEHTRQNLIRLEDVIGEVDRSRRQLKRQARQAERHQSIQQELALMIRRLLTHEAHLADQDRANVTRKRALKQNDVAAAAASLGGAEADLAAARKRHEELRGEVEMAREDVGQLVTSRERLEAFLERSADLLDSHRTALQRAEYEVNELGEGRMDLEARRHQSEGRLKTLEDALGEVATGLDSAREADRAAKEEHAAAEQIAATCRQELLKYISLLTSSRNRLRDVEREQDRVAYSLGQVDQERERLQTRRRENGERYDTAFTASGEASARVETLRGRRKSLVDQRSQLSENVTTARRETEALGHTAWELRHRLTGVERQLAAHTAATDQLATVLPAEVIAGQVSDYLHPDPELADDLDRMWREWLELPVVRAADLEPQHRRLVAQLEGRLRVVLMTAPEDLPARATPEGVDDLLMSAGIDQKDLGWLARVLPPAYRCDDSNLARRIADDRPEAIVLESDGALRQGRILELGPSGPPQRGALALRTERDELSSQIDDASSRAEEAGTRRQELQEELDELESQLAVIDRDLVEAEQKMAAATTVEESVGRELSRLERELESLETEAQRQRGLTGDLQGRRQEFEAEVSRMESRSAEAETAVERAIEMVEANRTTVQEALRHLDHWSAEERLAAERLGAVRGEIGRLDEEHERLEGRKQTLASEQKRLQHELEETEDEVVRSRARLAEEQGLLNAARERERRMGDETTGAAAGVERLDREVRSFREQHDRARESLHTTEVELTRADAEWQRLRDAARAELGSSVEGLLDSPVEEIPDVEELRSSITSQRDRLEKIGPVNLLAVRELSELDQRSEFLHTQKKDLVDSLKSLEGTIREIDTTCIERFVDTFEDVNRLFTETFSHLFGGGTARLDLVDEDDPLESGIDITAQPPGKKIQSVQLLSGGEKALTALSLLIALFRIKPSPFCILDEVDAPLDDANVERLADLVQAMTSHTQFVLITHNRRTMTRADVLYGVTMEEPGVSKVVSVRLED